MKQFLIKNIILIVVSLSILLFLFFILNKPSGITKIIEDSNYKIDSLQNLNNGLKGLLEINNKLREEDKLKITLLENDKKLLLKNLNKVVKEYNNIKIVNNKIPDDSVFLILKRKYNEDSIANSN